MQIFLYFLCYSKSPLFSDLAFRGEPERSVYKYMTEGETDERRRYGNKGDLLYFAPPACVGAKD